VRKFLIVGAVLASLLAVGAGARAADAASVPQRNLLGVACPGVKDCIAVGNDSNGFPVAESWNGTKWTDVAVGLPKGSGGGGLQAVSCMSTKNCVAVGYAYTAAGPGVALAESWNGKAWTLRPLQSTVGILSGLSCTSVNCVAVGGYSASGDNNALADFWNGSKWTAVRKLPAPKGSTSLDIIGISCPKLASCVAVGSSWAKTSYPVAETWSHNRWAVTTMPRPKGVGDGNADAISCVSPTTCYAVASTLITDKNPVSFAESWNGRGWTATLLSAPGKIPHLSGLSCRSSKSCLAVGEYGGYVYVDSGRAYAESWNGKTWTTVKVPTPAHGSGSTAGSQLNGDSCLPGLSNAGCMAVGSAGATGEGGYGFSAIWTPPAKWRFYAAA
jgi:hypothetical protein